MEILKQEFSIFNRQPYVTRMGLWVVLFSLLSISLANDHGNFHHEVSTAHFHMQDQSPAIELHATQDGIHIRTHPASLDVSSKLPQTYGHRNGHKSSKHAAAYRQNARPQEQFGPSHQNEDEMPRRNGGRLDEEAFASDWHSGRGDQFIPEYQSESRGYENRNGAGDESRTDQGDRNPEEKSNVGWRNQNKGSNPYRLEGDKNRVDKQGDSSGAPFDIHAVPPIIRHPVEPVKFDGSILDSLNRFQFGYGPALNGYRRHSMQYRHLHHGRNWLFRHRMMHSQHLYGTEFDPSLTSQNFRGEMNRADTSLARDRMLFPHSYLSPSKSTQAEYDPGSTPFTSNQFLRGMRPQPTFYKIGVNSYLLRKFARRISPTSSLFHRFYETPVTTSGSLLIPTDSWSQPPSDSWPPPGIHFKFQRTSKYYDNFPDPDNSKQLQGAGSYNYSPDEPNPMHSTIRMESYQRAPPNIQIRDSNYRIARILMGFPL